MIDHPRRIEPARSPPYRDGLPRGSARLHPYPGPR